jgi:EmrB/QacA subfamily drug resistance transporter
VGENGSVLQEDPDLSDPNREVTRAEFLNLFAAVFLPMFLAAVDQTLLATATPAIAASLGGLRDTSWIMVGYLLAAATITPVYGRLGDRRGRRDMLLAALAVFTLGSIACGSAQTLPQLIAARVLQGLGGGGLMTLSQALIGELVPPRERMRFQAYFALIFTTSSIGGPVLGGIVVTHVSWRWLFFANLPLALLAAWRLSRLPQGQRHPDAAGHTDIPGHLLFAVGALSLLFWLTSGGHRFAWESAPSFGLAALALVSLGALYWHESRHPGPFLPIDLLKKKAIGLSAVVVALFAGCLFSLIFYLPVYLQVGHRVSAQISGLLLLPVTAGMVAGAMTASRILRRTGTPYPIPIAGMGCAALGLFSLGLAPDSMVLVAALGFLTGLGLGVIMPTTQVLIQTVAGPTKLGAITAMAGLSRSTGGAAGAALFGAVVFSMIPEGARLVGLQGVTLPEITTAFHRAFLFASAVAALGAIVASRIPRVKLWDPK